MVNRRNFDPLVALIGGVLGVAAYVAGLFLTVPYATDAAGANRVLVVTFSIVLISGVTAGIFCRKRSVSRRGVWLTGAGAGTLASTAITVFTIGIGANAGSINYSGALQTLVAIFTVMVLGTGVGGLGWSRSRRPSG